MDFSLICQHIQSGYEAHSGSYQMGVMGRGGSFFKATQSFGHLQVALK